MLIRRPRRLAPGDLVSLVSPASTPSEDHVAGTVTVLETMGLRVAVGEHALDRWGYLAGTDADRASDFNDALRNPEVRAIVATRGGKGAYRIADRLDFDAARRLPKLIVGFSEITILHLALLRASGLTGVHGAPWESERIGAKSAASFITSVMTTDTVVVERLNTEPTSVLTTTGMASGRLIGGNQDSIATAAGWALPSFDGAILLLEAFNMRLGHIDRQLTMLRNAGHLKGIRGIAIGQYTECSADDMTEGNWTYLDVLRDRLSAYGVPILGGLPIGHGDRPIAVPIGTNAILDADRGTLTVESAVC
jgi:muramoyltetrapeptide carboxypeptidase